MLFAAWPVPPSSRWHTSASSWANNRQSIPTARLVSVADLDDDDFVKREAATAELPRLGRFAEAALKRALENKPSAEVRLRAEVLLKKLGEWQVSPSELQSLRALEVLELIGTPEARKIIESLEKGTVSRRVSEEAKAALGRLPVRLESCERLTGGRSRPSTKTPRRRWYASAACQWVQFRCRRPRVEAIPRSRLARQHDRHPLVDWTHNGGERRGQESAPSRLGSLYKVSKRKTSHCNPPKGRKDYSANRSRVLQGEQNEKVRAHGNRSVGVVVSEGATRIRVHQRVGRVRDHGADRVGDRTAAQFKRQRSRSAPSE